MSSPTVLIGVPAEQAMARAKNFEDMTSFLARAKQVYDSMMHLSLEIEKGGGQPLRLNVIPYADAAAHSRTLYEATSDGFSAVTYAHAYWQSLKHPWYDQLLRQFGRVEAEQEALRARDAAQLDRMAEGILSQVKVTAAANAFAGGMKSSGPQFQWDEALDKSVKAILEHTPQDQQQSVSDSILRMASKPREERLLAFEAFRLSVEQRERERFEQESLRIYKTKQAELALEAMTMQMTRCESIAEQIESAATDQFVAEIAELRKRLPSTGAVALEDRLEAIEHSLIKEKASQGLLQATIQALKRQGYRQVEVMGTLRPQDVACVYLMDPNDDKRLTLLQADEDEGRVAAMVVSRAEVQTSKSEQQLDLAAQTRLCNAMDVAERVLAQQWPCEVLRTPPGEKVKVDRRLKDFKVEATRRAGVQKQQQRSMPS